MALFSKIIVAEMVSGKMSIAKKWILALVTYRLRPTSKETCSFLYHEVAPNLLDFGPIS